MTTSAPNVTRASEAPAELLPPHSAEAELSVLGSMIVNPECIGEVIETLEADHFYRPAHRLIYQAIIDLFLAHVPADIVAVKHELSKRGALEEAGGYDYLAALVETVPNAANAAYYASIIREKAVLRALIQTCTGVIRKAREGGEDADRLLDEAQSLIFEVAAKRGPREVQKLSELLKGTFQTLTDIHDRKARIMGLPTAFHDLDDLISGLQGGQLYIIAGRPSMGKTSLALRMIECAAMTEKAPALLFSLEMVADQITQSMLCSHARVDSHKLRSGAISEEDFRKLVEGAGRLAEAPIFIDDSADISILELRARARRLKAEHKIGLVVVDYLQKLNAKVSKYEGREREISIISSQLKSLAKELSVPVIALAQLNRSAEGREDRKPMLSDLRESGTIEQDADVVMLLYREDYYKPDSEKKNICEVIVAKNRTGPTDRVELAFLREYARFESLTQRPPSV